MIWQLIPAGDYAFSINLKGSYLYFPIGKCNCNFHTFLAKLTLSVESFLPFGLATAPMVFTLLTKTHMDAFSMHGFSYYYILALMSWILIQSKHAGKRAWSFPHSLLVCFGYGLLFQIWTLHHFCFLCFWTVNVSISTNWRTLTFNS